MDTRKVRIQCPKCNKEGTIRGIKHHFTSVHADGESGRLAVVLVPVLRTRQSKQPQLVA